ncbi:preprotein translocase subunit YajC [Geotoga petraea]|jgi:preprotein translocase subunit YajC|uniref:Protein translocase subunit yajC n=1 Tax=Geotoga petraea TaxID=28234 RepID=A0A1G6LYP5_9BACT|nr:preprotein translocase subunit YajC [Geotoga petraea]TGG87561.1 preprotein translocase subunit YajC [Geotoga petraea]SDC48350.1 protein translocase subunit yajC [Geotoga petraea]
MLEKVIEFINFAPAGTTGDAAGAAGGTTDAAATGATGGFGSIWFIVILFVLMYVILILPQRRQEKKHKEMISQLSRGDKVMTAAGIIGKIVSIQNDRIRISTGDKTEIDITKNAVSAVLNKSEQPTTENKSEEDKK